MTAPAKPDRVLKPVASIDHILGPASAAATVVEYGDFECPSCGQAHAAMKILRAHFGPQLRFVYRHYPQAASHPHAEAAAEAAEAAAAQGRFWPYHDLLFEHQQHLDDRHLLDHARGLGLDMARFQYDLKDHVYRQRVQEHRLSGVHLALRGTPAFFVNGRFTDVSFGLQHLHEAIDKALAVPPN